MYKGLTQNLQVSIASNKYPAIVQMGYSYLNYAKDNFEYTTAQEVMNEYFPEDKEFFAENFLPNILELGQVDGEQVGIPYSISNPIMYINADLFKEAGLDPANPPKTWKEVAEAAMTMLEGNGGQMLKVENGITIPTFSSKESAEAYQLTADMIKNKSAIHASNDEGFQTFLNGKLGMVVTTIGKRENFESSEKRESFLLEEICL